ncbi:gluconolaconase [Parabacteroides sp. 52]|uniref:glycosyl hydrolase family 28-related protein n=1 Tax=unclassified Parabacteroides TaxID=2649774 RepID=UPI0013D01A56|nr:MULTISPECIES: glycosyl hydrolase family 28-related protein [unclassified Parabacteroides]MDH6534169.1 hypothetical protein [Parabacteroides sp. PM5-20]NDV54929.1 gluconolaconase [Parabacteroides sp. 52]
MRKYSILCFLFCLLGNLYGKSVLPEHASIYKDRMEDELAVYFTPEHFDIKADGSVDVSDALQQAINKVQENMRYGVVFIPEGTYRISKTIHLWKGIRLIGYGQNRPTILLGKNTPGFQEGEKKYMFHFTSDRPRGERPIQDANAGTFYSGIRNINIKIAEGNPSAIGIRFHAAQHCFLSHMDFHLSPGTIGVEDICNEIEYCRFFGGDYAIKTIKTAPGWQSLVIDSYFEKQQKAAILTEEAGLMIIRNHFKQVPTAVRTKDDRSEELWISDSRFEQISGPAIVVNNENNSRTQINLENIVCTKVPDFLLFNGSGKQIKAKGSHYLVKEFTHGLHIKETEGNAHMGTSQEIVSLSKLPPLVESDVFLLPENKTWVNLKSLGAKGDGYTDDTDVIEKAIADHQTLYLPSGHYRVTRPIVLKKHTNLVGLHPSATVILLRDSTPAYQGIGSPLPLLEAPQGGTNIVSGIGLNTSGINPRAVAAKWMAGERSMMNDVRFSGGHGTYALNGRDVRVYNDNRTADGIPYRKWDTQYWSLWITDGGGGTFKDIWTPSPYAAAGMFISNTSASGRIYFISIEHHVRNEVIIDNVSNWKMFGLQLETESGEGPYCLPVDIRNSKDILFVNTFLYRVSRVTTPVPYAIRTEDSQRLTFKGVHTHSWTKFPFDNSVYDATHDIQIRPREAALIYISGNAPAKVDTQASKVLLAGSQIEKLAGDFFDIDGMTTDSKGNIYFVDAHWQRIYCWTVEDELKLISDLPIYPQSLACDEKDNLIVVTRYMLHPSIFSRGEVHVFTFDPKDPAGTLQPLEEVPYTSQDVERFLFQTAKYRSEHRIPTAISHPVKTGYRTANKKEILPNAADLGQTFNLKPGKAGETFFISSYGENQTYRCEIDKNGQWINPRLFAETGENDVAVDNKGNVYIPAGEIAVYDTDGNFLENINVPERPSSIVFGGKDKKTLYIGARTSLYRVRID